MSPPSSPDDEGCHNHNAAENPLPGLGMALAIMMHYDDVCSTREVPMLPIPRRYHHFVFGVIQSGLTSLIAAGIASLPSLEGGHFLRNWLVSWLIAWVTMLPVVLLAAPAIRSLSLALTRDEPDQRNADRLRDPVS
jgi:Protein of unknown function (DUF2798)